MLLTADEVELKKQELETKPPATAMIQSALSAYELGLGVFPIAPRAKKPPLTPNGFKDASFDTDDIERWWTKTPDANIGISCGASGICVLDFDDIEDVPEWVDELKTYKVKTSRGLHVYLYGKRPTANMYNANGKHIGELKGLGGYVIGAGSEHPKGPIYTIIDDSPIITAPNDIDQLLKSPTRAPVDASTSGPKIPRGQHDTELHRIAGKLRHLGLEEEAIYGALVEVVEKRCVDYGSDYLDMCRKHAHNICKKPVGSEIHLTISGRTPEETAAKPNQAATASAPAPAKRLNICTANSVETRKIRWLWAHRVPLGKLCLFVGVPGSGKSLCAGDVAARLSSGAAWFDAENTFPPSESLLLCGEDDIEDTTIPRLQAAGADLSKIHFLKSVITGSAETADERELGFDQDLRQVEEYLQEHPEVRLIVVDPVSNYLGAAKMNSEQEIRAVLIPLKNLAEKMGVAIIGVMHLNKKADTGAINRVGGAMAFVGVARVVYLFQAQASDDEPEEGAVNRLQQHFMVVMKANITKRVEGLIYEIPARAVVVEGSDEYMPVIRFVGTTVKNAEGVLQQKSEVRGRPPESITVAKAWLREYLKDGPKPSGEVIKAAKELQNLGSRTVEKAKAELGVLSGKDGKAWLWSLPQQKDAINLNAGVSHD
jgi:putative DNA primase/helicase